MLKIFLVIGNWGGRTSGEKGNGMSFFCDTEAQFGLPNSMIHTEIFTLFRHLVFQKLLCSALSLGEAMDR